MREAGLRSVGVRRGRGRSDEVESEDVGDLGIFVLEFGLRGEGADELVGARELQGPDRGVDEGEVGEGWARVGGPVEEDDKGGVGVGE